MSLTEEMRDCFPHLDPSNHVRTSPCDPSYNCIAWAVGEVEEWWWPCEGAKWPEEVPREKTIDAFVLAFATRGYKRCDDGSLEEHYEKVVIYAQERKGKQIPTHAARQLSDGWWTSKLGPRKDIKHRDPENVNGPVYGEPIVFMKRPRPKQSDPRTAAASAPSPGR